MVIGVEVTVCWSAVDWPILGGLLANVAALPCAKAAVKPTREGSGTTRH